MREDEQNKMNGSIFFVCFIIKCLFIYLTCLFFMICSPQRSFAWTHNSEIWWRLSCKNQQHQDARRGNQHQLHGNISFTYRCCIHIAVDGRKWFKWIIFCDFAPQVEKSSVITNLSLELKVKYPQKSPLTNNLLYLTDVKPSSKVNRSINTDKLNYLNPNNNLTFG